MLQVNLDKIQNLKPLDKSIKNH